MKAGDLNKMRREYGITGLREAQAPADWVSLFSGWLARAAEIIVEPNAMVLATCGTDGAPGVRTVLLKSFDERGLVFCTSTHSAKGRQLVDNPRVSAVFGWYELERQVIVSGAVVSISAAESDEYFHARPRGSQLAAHASTQSAILTTRAELEKRFEQMAAKFPGQVPRPPYWVGFRIVPTSVEFWQGGRDRLHDRLRYRRTAAGDWLLERLSP